MATLKRALCLVVLGLGCDDRARPPPPPAPGPRPLALRPTPRAPLEPRAGEGVRSDDDPDPVGRCVRRNRSALGPELAGAFEALHDDALLEDACVLDLAVRARAPERCAAVRLSSLREGCVFRASIAAGRPDACPGAPGLRGRDPVCVALAARNPALCAAAAPTERVRCLALAARDPRPCDALDPLLRPACAQDLEALRAVLPALPRTAVLAPVPAANGWRGPVDDAGVDTPEPWLLRGLFVDETGALWIVDPAVGWPAADAMTLDRPQVGAVVPARRGSAVALDARLVVRGSLALSTADASLRAVVTLTRAARTRGGRVAGSVRFEGTTAGRSVNAELRFDTFVRDVVTAAALR